MRTGAFARKVGWAACAAALLAGCSAGTNPTDAPSVSGEQVTTAGGMQEWIAGVVACVQDAGWPTAELNSTGDGISVPDLTAQQREDFRRAHDVCAERAGEAPNSAPLSEDQVRELYAHLVEMVDCIEDRGYEVASEPPSETVFVETYLSGEPPWSPYVGLDTSMSPSDWDELNRLCPQAPWE